MTFVCGTTDFWTTKCVQCPAALDKLNQLATDYPEVQFVSICCDSLDGAREILQRHDAPRWDAVHHFFMNKADKERAKKLLGFASVPFYVVLDEEGGMVEKGNKIDLLEHVMDKENLDFVQVTPEDATTEERELVFDELDF